jgi:hypothetical protein
VHDLDRLVDAVRTQARTVVARAYDEMQAGAPIGRIMDHYVRRAFDIEAEADARAILASGGEVSAMSAIEDCLDELEALLQELDAEFPAQG